MLYWLQFGESEVSQGPLLKSLKFAAGVGARDNFGFVSHMVFLRKIAQMLHWLQFRDNQGGLLRSPFLTLRPAACLAKHIKTGKSLCICPNRKIMALRNLIRFLIHFGMCIAS